MTAACASKAVYQPMKSQGYRPDQGCSVELWHDLLLPGSKRYAITIFRWNDSRIETARVPT